MVVDYIDTMQIVLGIFILTASVPQNERRRRFLPPLKWRVSAPKSYENDTLAQLIG